MLRPILEAAVDEGIISSSPYRNISKASLRGDEMLYLDRDKLHALADAAGKDSTLILTAGYMRLRWGELRAVRRKRLTLKREVVIEDQLIEPRGHLKPAKLKTNAARRRLPLPDWLCPLLLQQLEDRAPDDFIFVGGGGAPLRDHWVRRHFKKAVHEVGLPGHFRFHDLRHTCAALLISRASASTSSSGGSVTRARAPSSHTGICSRAIRSASPVPSTTFIATDSRPPPPGMRTLCVTPTTQGSSR
ncbi:MAG: tyrosine-type recombinase/integrase [Actinobacteria bacterium]|nr:tyrosine-type recombinase/integrase [Actinomycetota bacterium]